MTEQIERARVVAVARTWLATPFVSRAKVKGAGADCGTLIAACFEEAGLLPPIELPDYTVQWHLNTSDELYLAVIEHHMGRIEGPPLPGDIVLWKLGRAFSHAAIVVAWPTIIHALWSARHVILDDAERSPELQRVRSNETPDGSTMPRERRFYSYWAMPQPSCAGNSASKTRVNALSTRASTSCCAAEPEVVDGRVKPGHDDGEAGAAP